MYKQAQYYFKKFIRHGITFNRILNELRASQYYTPEELAAFQNQKLRKMIKHCYNNVPYYKDLFRQLKLKPDDISTKADLIKLPYIDKFTVKENYDKFIAKDGMRLFRNEAHTSGSTGTPAKFLRDYYATNYENAALWRLWESAGDTGLKRITLRAENILPSGKEEPPFWKYNPANKELIMSSYHLSDKTADIYLEKIKEFDPRVLYAYPSTACLLANQVRKRNVILPLKAVFTSSETLSDDQRELVESTFNCRIYDWYGQVERVVAIGNCELGTYHIIEDYSIVEFINTELGLEPVGTGFSNYMMPLIRYRAGDIIKLSSNKCKCGRHFREVEQISGREVDYILTPEGAKITIPNRIPRGIDHIIETQFVQENPGEVIINLVTDSNYTEQDEEKLINKTHSYTSPSLKVIINRVDQIPRGPNGKFLSVINRLDKKQEELNHG